MTVLLWAACIEQGTTSPALRDGQVLKWMVQAGQKVGTTNRNQQV